MEASDDHSFGASSPTNSQYTQTDLLNALRDFYNTKTSRAVINSFLKACERECAELEDEAEDRGDIIENGPGRRLEGFQIVQWLSLAWPHKMPQFMACLHPTEREANLNSYREMSHWVFPHNDRCHSRPGWKKLIRFITPSFRIKKVVTRLNFFDSSATLFDSRIEKLYFNPFVKFLIACEWKKKGWKPAFASWLYSLFFVTCLIALMALEGDENAQSSHNKIAKFCLSGILLLTNIISFVERFIKIQRYSILQKLAKTDGGSIKRSCATDGMIGLGTLVSPTATAQVIPAASPDSEPSTSYVSPNPLQPLTLRLGIAKKYRIFFQGTPFTDICSYLSSTIFIIHILINHRDKSDTERIILSWLIGSLALMCGIAHLLQQTRPFGFLKLGISASVLCETIGSIVFWFVACCFLFTIFVVPLTLGSKLTNFVPDAANTTTAADTNITTASNLTNSTVGPDNDIVNFPPAMSICAFLRFIFKLIVDSMAGDVEVANFFARGSLVPSFLPIFWQFCFALIVLNATSAILTAKLISGKFVVSHWSARSAACSTFNNPYFWWIHDRLWPPKELVCPGCESVMRSDFAQPVTPFTNNNRE